MNPIMKKDINIKAIKRASLMLLAAIGIFQSCEQKDKEYLGELSPYIALEDVRALHKGTDVALNKQTLTGASFIYGTVISDHKAGNVPEGTIVLQQWKRNRLRGITLNVGAAAVDYKPGDSIVVNIENKQLVKDGFLTVMGLENSDVKIISSGNPMLMISTTASNINNTPQNYEGTLVRIIGGQMYPKPAQDEGFEGNKLMINGSDSISITTLPTANFAKLQVPRNITVSGLMLGAPADAKAKYSIYPRYQSDIIDVSDPEVPEYIGTTPVIISGFCTDPNGADGNYEYVQLKANVDIDFTEVPFSLVTSTNAGSVLHTAGWATGAARTYKFNITSGKVKKGEYFYVGGHQRRINGPNSTVISSANWVRYIQYSTTSGDGFGNPSSGLLPNSGNAGGIALFIGTNVAEQTIPIDVVFYGGNGTASIISPDLSLGYRIANTDHYFTYVQETGDPTPYFSMGEGKNNFRFPHYIAGDIGVFFKLGGTFNMTTRKWSSPREHTFVVMTKQSTLSEIEAGEGITSQVD